jgi:tRNA nucleotidyltransferase (CCA-adding enzyme)
VALCRRYGLSPYRYRRQRLTTVVLRAPRDFVHEVLWPEFQELNQALTTYLSEVTLKVIREEVHGDASEAAEVAGVLPSGSSP